MRKPALVVLIAAIAVPAAAQFSTAPMPSWYDYGTMRQQTINGINLRNRIGRTEPPAARPRGAAPRSAPAHGVTTFRSTGGWILPDQLAAREPQRRAEVAAYYARLLEAHRDMAARKGVANDVARAAAFAISSLYYVYRGGAQPSEATLDALRREVSEAFMHSAPFQRMSDRERQLIYERFVIQGTGISATFESARSTGNRRQLERLRAMAGEDLARMVGAPASRIRLTEAGLSTD